MRKHILFKLSFVLYLAATILFIESCGNDHYKMLEHKWRITTDEVTLELHPDSTFALIQQRNTPITGIWKLDDHSKSIIFKEKGNGEKKMGIVELTNTRLVLSNNGEELDYIRAD
jgi:hypothetical protein